MAAPQGSENQLLELILQLKKTTPAAAKQILNSQPQIAYAVIALLVSMNAIDIEVFKKTLGDFAAQQAASAQAGPSTSQPAPAIPPHMQQQSHYRTATPPAATPTPPVTQPQPGYGHNGYSQPQGYGYSPAQYGGQSSQGGGYGNGGYQSRYGHGQQGAGHPPSSSTPQAPAQAQASVLSQLNPAILDAIPEDQKSMIIHVLSLTPEAISKLSPNDRANVMQLRTTLGLPQ
ncbi:hypothetical protein PQX77_015601 [Marasmius sp. AFHP31]|nr:hypothetical protein PQX77_015601 [Marasmius sp. AFHP31]